MLPKAAAVLTAIFLLSLTSSAEQIHVRDPAPAPPSKGGHGKKSIYIRDPPFPLGRRNLDILARMAEAEAEADAEPEAMMRMRQKIQLPKGFGDGKEVRPGISKTWRIPHEPVKARRSLYDSEEGFGGDVFGRDAKAFKDMSRHLWGKGRPIQKVWTREARGGTGNGKGKGLGKLVGPAAQGLGKGAVQGLQAPPPPPLQRREADPEADAKKDALSLIAGLPQYEGGYGVAPPPPRKMEAEAKADAKSIFTGNPRFKAGYKGVPPGYGTIRGRDAEAQAEAEAEADPEAELYEFDD